jgi:carbohydrate kinase (thermoresistant glucokinase family)
MARQVAVMGVAGVGKTTIAEALAQKLGWPFRDGDALHPQANVDKMASGQPLNDEDRAPWLAAIGDWFDARAAEGRDGVVSCSALKQAYRDTLRQGRPNLVFVYLKADQQVVSERLAGRKGHFWPASLLASQYADLEEPDADEPVIVLDAREPIETLVDQAAARLGG